MASRTCAIHQPNLFPRLSTLTKLYSADVWVVLDDVQLNMRDYQHRAKLLHPDGVANQWLTLPVRRPFGHGTRINEALLLDQAKSARRVSELTRQHYSRSRRWSALCTIIDAVTAEIQLGSHLVDVTELSTRLLLAQTGWRGDIVRSSTFTVRPDRSARLADLAFSVGADEYLCGTGGASYLNEVPFMDRRVGVRYVRMPDLSVLREYKQASGIWWLAAVSWSDLQGLLWQDLAA